MAVRDRTGRYQGTDGGDRGGHGNELALAPAGERALAPGACTALASDSSSTTRRPDSPLRPVSRTSLSPPLDPLSDTMSTLLPIKFQEHLQVSA